MSIGESHLDHLERAVAQDPLNVVFRRTFAMILGVESPGRAAIEARKAMEIDERHWLPYYAMSLNRFGRGEMPEARHLAERSVAAAQWMPLPAGSLAGLLRRLGENNDADAVVAGLKSPSTLVIYHLVCSDINAAADSFDESDRARRGATANVVWRY